MSRRVDKWQITTDRPNCFYNWSKCFVHLRPWSFYYILLQMIHFSLQLIKVSKNEFFHRDLKVSSVIFSLLSRAIYWAWFCSRLYIIDSKFAIQAINQAVVIPWIILGWTTSSNLSSMVNQSDALLFICC